MSSTLHQDTKVEFKDWKITPDLDDLSRIQIMLQQRLIIFLITKENLDLETSFSCQIIDPETAKPVLFLELFQEEKGIVKVKPTKARIVDSFFVTLLARLRRHRPELPLGDGEENMKKLKSDILDALSSWYLVLDNLVDIKHNIRVAEAKMSSYAQVYAKDPVSDTNRLNLYDAKCNLYKYYLDHAEEIYQLDPWQEKPILKYKRLAMKLLPEVIALAQTELKAKESSARNNQDDNILLGINVTRFELCSHYVALINLMLELSPENNKQGLEYFNSAIKLFNSIDPNLICRIYPEDEYAELTNNLNTLNVFFSQTDSQEQKRAMKMQ